MRKTVLYISMSLDGYIADTKGGVGWLAGDGSGDDINSYDKFIRCVDTVVMGRRTYDQIVTELSPGRWVYEGLETYVITHRKIKTEENITAVNEAPNELIKRLRSGMGKDIWICGGADIVRQAAAEDLIDCWYITVIPVILGAGISLFENIGKEIPLKLIESRSYNGMTELVYVRR